MTFFSLRFFLSLSHSRSLYLCVRVCKNPLSIIFIRYLNLANVHMQQFSIVQLMHIFEWVSECVCLCIYQYSIFSRWYGISDDEVRSDLSDDNRFRWSVKLTRSTDEIWILICCSFFQCVFCVVALTSLMRAHDWIDWEFPTFMYISK